jgi:hypothetical protein
MNEVAATSHINRQGHEPGNFSQPAYFSPSEYFLGIAGKAVSAGARSHVSLPGRGEVLIVPDKGAYFADVPDMVEFCRAPASEFKVTHARAEEYGRLSASATSGHIPELLWEAALHASQGRLVGSWSNEESVHIYDVVRFHHWPNLTRVSQTPNTMRICALLTREPSSIMLVSRKLGIDHEEMYQVYSAACSYGIVNVISNHLGRADVQASIGDDVGPAPDAHRHGLIRALLAKIAGL